MSYKTEFASNNDDLRAILDVINALPEAGGGGGSAAAVIRALEVTENGTYAAPDGVDGYAPVTVNVPVPDGYIKPSGVKNITENGTHDVTDYASVKVNVASGGGDSGGGDTEDENWIGDGNTHVWISLQEGRTSPVLCVCPNGTVTVDWGDGTTPDTLTGNNAKAAKWTPTHNYAAAGDYVITLTVDGEMGFYGAGLGSCILGFSTTSSDKRNTCYQNAVQKIEVGGGVTAIGDYAFRNLFSLKNIKLPDGITSIGTYAFYYCYSLANIVIPYGVESIGTNAFYGCSSLRIVVIPDSVKTLGNYAFHQCCSLNNIEIPDSVTSVGTYTANQCFSLNSVVLPNGITSITASMFNNCYSLNSIEIPDSVTIIDANAFNNCNSLVELTIPAGVTSIGNYGCRYLYGLKRLRFDGAKPPTAGNSSTFQDLAADCIISVPVGSLAAYKAATNYPSASTYTYIEED